MFVNLSYWEQKTWFTGLDFAVIGSGIVGLTAALELRAQHPSAKIVVFERGMLPSGASTKNAGFACFGSVSELLDDLNSHSPEEMVALVEKRVNGLESLMSLLGKDQIGYDSCGGYELFSPKDGELYEECLNAIDQLNQLLLPIFKSPVFEPAPNDFGFANIQPQLIKTNFEGKIDTGAMMKALIKKAHASDILIVNGATITNLEESAEGITIQINESLAVRSKYAFVATNGLAGSLLNEDLQPARAQVLITEPIPDLNWNGTFHLDKGYYYFRNIDNRILFGGGRNLDIQGETTTEMQTTDQIQMALENLLSNTILPGKSVEIAQRWSGIMGVGSKKAPIVKQLSPHLYCGIRLGGMGVAIGADTGRALANLID